MDADIDAARRNIQREWNEKTRGIIWPSELLDDAADRAIECRCNERHPPLSQLAQQVGVPGSPTFLPKKIPRLFGCVFSALSTSDCSDA
jgi:hypothetical protein